MTVGFEREDGIGTVTLNRPEKLNAISSELARELVEVLGRVESDDQIRGVIITGAGRAFSAGGDVEFMQQHVEAANWTAVRELLDAGARVVSLLHGMPKPTIAALNGPAVGAGASLALACDLRIASPAASFGLVFSRLGLHPDWGGTYFLPRLVGTGKALELILSGDVIPADDAFRLGIFNRIVPADQLLTAARETAHTFAATSPLALRLARRAVHDSVNMPLAEVLDLEIVNQLQCFPSPQAKAGIAAFLTKRQPKS